MSARDSGSRGADGARAQVCRMFERIDACDWDALAEVFHPHVVYERPGYERLVGLEHVLRFYRTERAIASGRHRLDGIVIEGDRAACWGRLEGTLKDGSPANVEFADVYTFVGDRIKTRRSYFFRPQV